MKGPGLRSLLPLLDCLMCLGAAAHFACGGVDGPAFRSAVDGSRPILLLESDKLKRWASGIGKPAGARQRMLEIALPWVSTLWLPNAVGAVQPIPVDLDDDPDGPCAREHYSLWSTPGQPAIWVCPVWIHCKVEGDGTLYGQAGCNLELAHELGHVLGARKHAAQGARSPHQSGPVMCGWQSDCIDPKRTDFSADEDVPLICGDGGHGGRCAQW